MSQATAVSLTEDQLKFVDRLVQSGRFNGAGDVVATGLQLLEKREEEAASFIAKLETEIAGGIASGEAEPMESVEERLAGFRRQARG